MTRCHGLGCFKGAIPIHGLSSFHFMACLDGGHALAGPTAWRLLEADRDPRFPATGAADLTDRDFDAEIL